jgi:hypothetical protein
VNEEATANLDRDRVLIDACLRLGIYFFWQGPGTLLIAQPGVTAVLKDVMDSGFSIVGYEAFELDGVNVHPRLDLIYDEARRPDISDVTELVSQWPADVWVDVTLT